ncbi:Coiled-coil domain-containing 58 [Carabus blaptoides fortunei]
MSSNVIVECGDFLEFQDALKNMRTIDDKIIYALNTSIPTDSFRSQVDATSTCKKLYENVKSGHEERANAIKKCITVSANKVQNFKHQRENNNDDFTLLKKLRAEQTKFRLLQVELSVEEVVKQRTTKVFNERCRGFFHADSEK